MTNSIDEKFNSFIKKDVSLEEAYDLYCHDIIDEESLLKAINPALTRLLDKTVNKKKYEKAVSYYMKRFLEVKDAHNALLATSKETGLDYRALKQFVDRAVDKKALPKQMGFVKEEFHSLGDLIMRIDSIYQQL